MSCSEQLHGDEITLHAANTCLLRAPSAFIVYKRGPLQAACGRRMLPQLAIAVFATIKRPCHPQQEACERTHRLDLEARAVVRVEVHDLAQPAAAGCGGCRGCRCGKRCERFPKRCSSSVRARVAGAVRAARAAIAPAAAPCAPPRPLAAAQRSLPDPLPRSWGAWLPWAAASRGGSLADRLASAGVLKASDRHQRTGRCDPTLPRPCPPAPRRCRTLPEGATVPRAPPRATCWLVWLAATMVTVGWSDCCGQEAAAARRGGQARGSWLIW